MRPQTTAAASVATAPVKKSGAAKQAAVKSTSPTFRDSRTAALVAEVIENLKQNNQEELEVRREYGLK